MKTIYFTRHGQTIWNVENKICGATDIDLTPLGHEQAITLGNLLKKENYPIDRILCSPLMRAQKTAQHIADITGLPLAVEPRLKEQNFGQYEGTARNGEEFRLAKQQFINHYGTGESMFSMAQRIYNLLDDLKQQEETYLLVAHNGIARFMESYFHDMDNEAFAAFGIKNCEIKTYYFED